MAYHVFAAGEYDPESPLVTQFFSDMIGNFAGLANGDTGHPQIVPAAIEDSLAGIEYSEWRYAQSGGLTPTKVHELIAPRDGVYRTSMWLKKSTDGADNTGGQVYKNGSTHGVVNGGNTTSYVEFTEDLTFVKGDLIQLYITCITTARSIFRVGMANSVAGLYFQKDFNGDLQDAP